MGTLQIGIGILAPIVLAASIVCGVRRFLEQTEKGNYFEDVIENLEKGKNKCQQSCNIDDYVERIPSPSQSEEE